MKALTSHSRINLTPPPGETVAAHSRRLRLLSLVDVLLD